MSRPQHMKHLTLALLTAVLGASFAEAATAQPSPEQIEAMRQRFRRGRQRAQEAQEPKKEESDKVEKWTAIQGGDVYVGDGSLLRRATVLIADDKIHAVGSDVELPEGTEVIDATGKIVSPGFVILGASGLGAGRGGSPIDGANPFDSSIKLGLAAGITSFHWSSGGGSSSPGGNTALVKLSYGDLEGMVGAENPTNSMRLPLNPQDLKKFRELIEKTKEYLQKKEELAGKSEGEKLKAPNGADGLVDVMTGKKRLWVSVGGGGGRGFFGGGGGGSDLEAIKQGCELARLLGQGIVFNKPTTAWVVPDEIAATGSMVIDSPRSQTPADEVNPETTGSNLAQAAKLHAAGVPVGVVCPGGRFGGASIGLGGILGQDLNTPAVDAAYAVRGGMPNRAALRTLTLDAARIAGVADRVGSLEKGKDADVLILDGDPLHYRTLVQTAFVNGKVVYEKDEEPFYRHIRR